MGPRDDRAGLFWGLLDQAASSATTLVMSVAAGRILGPQGLGAMAVGFSAYLFLLGFQRALISEPLVVGTAAGSPGARRESDAHAFTTVLAYGVVGTLVLLGAGAAAGGIYREGFQAFAPWVLTALLQDFWRAVLYRERRSGAAAACDAVRLAVMLAAVPLLRGTTSLAPLVTAWGVGGALAAVMAWSRVPTAPGAVVGAFRWWKQSAWPLGRWLASEAGVSQVGGQGTTLLLATILGGSALGGLRALQSLFSPLNVLGPALAFPGLPAVSRALGRSEREARVQALRLSLVGTGPLLVFTLLIALRPAAVLGFVYGDAFRDFGLAAFPLAAGQTFSAAALGAGLLLKAKGRGDQILRSRALGAAVTVMLAPVLGALGGFAWAAWGMAVGGTVGSVLLIANAFTRQSAVRAGEVQLPTSTSGSP